jgi:hypothetical protein
VVCQPPVIELANATPSNHVTHLIGSTCIFKVQHFWPPLLYGFLSSTLAQRVCGGDSSPRSSTDAPVSAGARPYSHGRGSHLFKALLIQEHILFTFSFYDIILSADRKFWPQSSHLDTVIRLSAALLSTIHILEVAGIYNFVQPILEIRQPLALLKRPQPVNAKHNSSTKASQEIMDQQGGLHESQAPQVLAIIITFPILAAITVLLRLYTRLKIISNASIDDVCVVVAMVNFIPRTR